MEPIGILGSNQMRDLGYQGGKLRVRAALTRLCVDVRMRVISRDAQMANRTVVSRCSPRFFAGSIPLLQINVRSFASCGVTNYCLADRSKSRRSLVPRNINAWLRVASR